MHDLGKKGFDYGSGGGRVDRIESRNGFDLGDAVRLPGIEAVFEVIDLSDPSLVGLRAPSGRMCRAGWRVISKLKTKVNYEN